MSDILVGIAVIAIWVVLQTFVFPRLGIQT